MQITGNTIIGDIIDQEGCADIFVAHGMHCMGCPASRGETLQEACETHEIDCDELIEQLNTRFGANKPE